MAAIGYFDYRAAGSKQRRRIIFRQAGAGTLTAVGTPAWGADPPPGSNWTRIPQGAIVVTGNNDAGYDKFLTGLEMASTTKLTVDFRAFATDRFGRPSPALAEISDWIRNYVAPNAGTLTITDTIGGGASYTRTFDLLNLITIYSDEGNPTIPVGSFTLRFQGVQRKLPTKKGKIYPGRTLTAEYELYSAARATLDNTLMPDVCAWLLRKVAPKNDGTGSADAAFYKLQIEHAWEDTDGEQLAWLHQPINTAAEYWRFYDLFAAVEEVAGLVFSQFQRSAADSYVTLRKNAGYIGEYCTVFDHVTFYRRLFDAEISRGSALTSTDLYFEGRTTINIHESEGSPNRYAAGGLLIDGHDEKMTLCRKGYTAWSFLADAIASTGAKGKTWHWGYNSFMVVISPVLSTRAAAKNITTADIVNMGFDQGESPIEYEESYGVTANISVGLQHTRGDDRAEHKVTGFGSPNEQGGAVKLLWDNMPVVGSRDDWQMITDWTTDDGAHFDRAFVMHRTTPWKVFYFGAVAGSTRELPILVHHECTIDNGEIDLTLTSTGAALPTSTDNLSLPNPAQRAQAITDFVNNIRVVFSAKQRLTVLPVAVGRMLMGVFGREKNTLYRLTLKPGIVTIADIGDELRLSPIGAGFEYSAQALVNTSQANATDLPGRTWVMKATHDDATDRVTVELIGLRFQS